MIWVGLLAKGAIALSWWGAPGDRWWDASGFSNSVLTGRTALKVRQRAFIGIFAKYQIITDASLVTVNRDSAWEILKFQRSQRPSLAWNGGEGDDRERRLAVTGTDERGRSRSSSTQNRALPKIESLILVSSRSRSALLPTASPWQPCCNLMPNRAKSEQYSGLNIQD
jgi:hypothetical protein